MNFRLLRALEGKNEGRPPIWIMRQAGRYLPEYRALRSRYSFHEMHHEPELIAKVTQLPLQRFDLDAAILFSDILVVAEAFGKPFEFIEGTGPVLQNPLRMPEEIKNLPPADSRALSFVAEGIQLLKNELKVPLIGFCGGPFTVASYLIEGGTSRDLRRTKQWMLREPESFHQLLQLITQASLEYLRLQIAAGVEVIQIFDSWANCLAYPQFCQFSLAYLKQLCEGVQERPVILFCRGSSLFAEALAGISPAAISLDWGGSLSSVRQRVGGKMTLQGNLDPDILYAPPALLRHEVERLLIEMEGDPAYIFNLGHGIAPDVSVESVALMVDCVTSEAACRLR